MGENPADLSYNAADSPDKQTKDPFVSKTIFQVFYEGFNFFRMEK